MRGKTIVLAVSLLMAACSKPQAGAVAEAPKSDQLAVIDGTIADLKRTDPDIQRFFDGAYGYVVFPSIGKGGLLVGGAHGTGWVYEHGRIVGEAKMNQVTVGAQAGAQSYAEVIFFRDPDALNAFKAGKTELGAEVTAVVLKERASKDAGYNPSGIAVFILPKGGAMAEASVGGQKFSYEPIASARAGVAPPRAM